MKWKPRKDFSVYSGTEWRPVPLAYTASEKIKGMTVVAHRRTGEKANHIFWDISEETSRLRLTNGALRSRALAWDDAVMRCEKYDAEFLASVISRNVAQQVLKTLKGDGS